MIDGKNFFDQPVKMVLEQINTFERLPLVKEMTIIILKDDSNRFK